MSERYTVKDVRRLAESVANDAVRLGILDPDALSRVVVERGSQTYGRAWRLFLKDENTGALRRFPGTDSTGYLGWSAREAWRTLQVMRYAWDEIAREH